MKSYFLIISTISFLFLLAQTASAGNNTIRVSIAHNRKAVSLKAAEGLIIEGAPSTRRERKVVFTASSIGTRPVKVSSAGAFIQVNGKSYRGTIELRNKKGGLLVINDLNLEEYLQGVVAAEIPHDWEFEALKAQAVASRTYALYQKQISAGRPYDIVATVDGQVYSGKGGERESAVRAVRETEGMVLTYQGKIIPAFYHASCGGHTESAWELWGLDAPYLRGVECDCQRISKYGAWEKRISTGVLASALAKQGYRLKKISRVEIVGITAAGRVKQVDIHHAGGVARVPAETLRSAIGYAAIPSVFFEIETEGDEIVISGRGLGHGVGLCQWGAREMAQRGRDYKAILMHYYPGTVLSSINLVSH